MQDAQNIDNGSPLSNRIITTVYSNWSYYKRSTVSHQTILITNPNFSPLFQKVQKNSKFIKFSNKTPWWVVLPQTRYFWMNKNIYKYISYIFKSLVSSTSTMGEGKPAPRILMNLSRIQLKGCSSLRFKKIMHKICVLTNRDKKSKIFGVWLPLLIKKKK